MDVNFSSTYLLQNTDTKQFSVWDSSFMKGGPTQTTFSFSHTNMIAKNALNSLLLVLLSLFFQTCCGNDHHHKVEEILKFCNNNGHKFIEILADEIVPNFRTYSLVLKSNYTIRGRLVTIENLGSFIENLKTLTGNRDFLIVEKNKNIEFSEILNIMNTRKIQKSLLVIKEEEVEAFKVRNSYFLESFIRYFILIT